MIGVLSIIPAKFWLIGGIAVAVLVWGASGHLKAKNTQRKWEKEIAQQKEDFIKATEKLQREKDARNERNQVVDVKNVAAKESDKKTISDLRAMANGLREQLAAAQANRTAENSSPVCGLDDPRSKTIQRLFTECVELVQEGAGRVKELGTKTNGLQDYIREVCLK